MLVKLQRGDLKLEHSLLLIVLLGDYFLQAWDHHVVPDRLQEMVLNIRYLVVYVHDLLGNISLVGKTVNKTDVHDLVLLRESLNATHQQALFFVSMALDALLHAANEISFLECLVYLIHQRLNQRRVFLVMRKADPY